ncbi:MAG: preprotein translocase subunit YajC [Mariprofundaceae bacterium]
MSKSLLSVSITAAAASMAVITPAFAEGAAGQGGGFASFVPLILIMVIFYFLLIRPQQKRVKEHRNVIEALKKGDKVITGGGCYGTVTDVKEDIMKVEIAEGVRVKVKRDTIVGLAD